MQKKAVTVINMECFDAVKGEYRIQGCESEDDNVYVVPKANWADQGGILYLQYELTGEGILLYNGGKETVLEGVRVYPEDE